MVLALSDGVAGAVGAKKHELCHHLPEANLNLNGRERERERETLFALKQKPIIMARKAVRCRSKAKPKEM